ncbi:MAG: sigma-54-dependent Fis family transcriptional regulator [bacterium]
MTSVPERLEDIFELADLLGRQNDFQEVLRLVAQKAASLLHAEAATIMMINPQTRHTVKTILQEGYGAEDRRYLAVHTHVGGWVIKQQQAFVSLDLRTDARFAQKLFEHSPVAAVLAAPLRSEGVVLGALVLVNVKVAGREAESLLDDLQKFAAVVSPFLRNVQKLQHYFDAPLPEDTLLSKYEAAGLLGKSRKYVGMLKAMEAAARCEVRVLLEGQSGTGKELVAKAIHRFSPRGDGPFIAIDCGAIAEHLVESELFGHVKGAFTGASSDRTGLLEEAHHGTLFMDEIANLSLEMQAKFMRVLQTGEIRPVGGNKTRRVEVRIISASSTPLRKLVEALKFREDLFYRLHVYPVQVPSLNERQEDIPLLANYFLKKFAAQQGKEVEAFHEEIAEFMQQRQWAGNIRELENFVERLMTLAPTMASVLERDHLPAELQKEMKKIVAALPAPPASKSLSELLSEYEEQVLRQALQAHGWNQSKTARALKISEQTLRYKMGKLGIVKVLE